MNSRDTARGDAAAGGPVVLLPGWATDRRFYGLGGVGRDWIVPESFAPLRYMDGLAARLEDAGGAPATVIGWSLGAFAAVEFAKKHPALVLRLVLVGVRRRYPARQIEEIAGGLSMDRRRCLTRFYKECFLPAQADDYRRFRAALMERYLEEMDAAQLVEGLEYLGAAGIDPSAFPAVPVTFIHGARDVIAPVDEARLLAGEIPGARITIVSGAGHAVCAAKGFCSTVCDV